MSLHTSMKTRNDNHGCEDGKYLLFLGPAKCNCFMAVTSANVIPELVLHDTWCQSYQEVPCPMCQFEGEHGAASA